MLSAIAISSGIGPNGRPRKSVFRPDRITVRPATASRSTTGTRLAGKNCASSIAIMSAQASFASVSISAGLSTEVESPAEIETLAKDAWADMIAIEEAQFFPASLVPVVERLADAGRTVILSLIHI